MRKLFCCISVCLLLISCNKEATQESGFFNKEKANSELVWGTGENYEKYKCCWVSDPGFNTIRIYEFFDDFTYKYHSRWKSDGSMVGEPIEDVYDLRKGEIHPELPLYTIDGKPEASFWYYRISSDGNTLSLMNAGNMQTPTLYTRKPSTEYPLN